MICCIWSEVVNHFEGLTTFQLPADGVLGYSTFKGILAYWNPLTFTENFHISRTFVSGRLNFDLDATYSKIKISLSLVILLFKVRIISPF